MRSPADNSPLLHRADKVGLANCTQPVGDDDRSAIAQKPVQSFLNQRFGGGIDARRGFIENENLRIGQDRSGDADQLALTHREVGPPFQDLGLVTVG